MGRKRRIINELTQQEVAMFRALTNDSRAMCTYRWRYTSKHDLRGKKSTNLCSGEVSIVFDVIPKDSKRR